MEEGGGWREEGGGDKGGIKAEMEIKGKGRRKVGEREIEIGNERNKGRNFCRDGNRGKREEEG